MELESLSDEALVSRARNGCQQSFTLLYQRHQGRIYRFSHELSGSAAAAEEVTQEVFLVLLAEMDRYDASHGSLLAYLIGVARNQTYRWLRKNNVYLSLEPAEVEAEPASVDMTADLTRKESIEALGQAIASLPLPYREVLVLCDLEELDYAQAAQALGCPIGTVRSRLHRARALLAEKCQASMRCSA